MGGGIGGAALSYDVIVVGGRVAGAATAMLLARAGLRVLVVDRANPGTDTLSTHQVQVPGVARLHRWGLLDRVVASGAPPTREVLFDPGMGPLIGRYPTYEGVDALYSPRRTVLDPLLADAARAAGAEVRYRFIVDELISSGGRVTGIRGHAKGGAPVTEHARLVVGADGKHSSVAAAVGAPSRRRRAPRTVATYTYWSGVNLPTARMYGRPRRTVAAFPTNDDLLMTYVAAPLDEFASLRADPEAALLATLDRCGDLGERVRAGERAEPVRATPDVPNVVRRSYGPGWALVGDAGLVMDPISGQGIGNAFADAELLTAAAVTGLSGGTAMAAALLGYQRERDRQRLPMFNLTLDLANLAGTRADQQVMFRAMEGRPEEINRFLGLLAGTMPPREYFSLTNLRRLVGTRGLAAMLGSRLLVPRRRRTS